ncbi:NAD(P)H-dependent flavin oxidoreductase [Desulfovibrio ferrophilus]|uniref:NAD(P)H-dependent flavin oxidoreductase n=1 Tax=Desulfovibrio ferrophilus TaxID=241368 RepID=UPI000F837BB6|nr:nitronate monooxygenase family protein [Desulfovibrio ferrophilus]
MKMPELTIGDLVAKVPIIQGGMGVGISLSGLASAVANEGGIGVIAAAMIGFRDNAAAKDSEAHVKALTRELRAARDNSDGILGVNIMVALTNFADMVRTSVKEGADIIFSGAGLPLDLPGYLTDGAKTKLAPIVSSGRAAKIITKKWLSKFDYLPDAFVVEGPKAGGHLGFKVEQLDDPDFRLEKLVEEVIEAVRPFEEQTGRRVPVIAAGGVYDGQDIRKMLQLGASGVQMGTRFVATHECDADERFKQSFVDATEADVEIIKSPVGLPGRAVRSKFIDAVRAGKRKPFRCPFHCIKTCDIEKSPYCIASALTNAVKGKLEHGFAFAGSNVHRVKEIISVHELIASLKTEYIGARA